VMMFSHKHSLSFVPSTCWVFFYPLIFPAYLHSSQRYCEALILLHDRLVEYRYLI